MLGVGASWINARHDLPQRAAPVLQRNKIAP
jgi:hypothetical protein